jgi:hypothetical protein
VEKAQIVPSRKQWVQQQHAASWAREAAMREAALQKLDRVTQVDAKTFGSCLWLTNRDHKVPAIRNASNEFEDEPVSDLGVILQ